MPAYAVFLRGVNVGGRKLIPMADLKKVIEGMGFTEVRTLLHSGNIVLHGAAKSAPAYERDIEAAVTKKFRVAIDCLVRTAGEWETIVAGNPFRAEAERDPARLVLVLLKDAPKPKAVEALTAAIKGPETVIAGGRQLWAVYPAGQGESKLTLPLIETKLATRGTARNWNTVLKVAEMLNE